MKNFTRRIGYTYVGAIAVVTVALGVISSLQIESYFLRHLIGDLSSQSIQISHLIRSGSFALTENQSWYGKLQDYARLSNLRLTLIAEDGTVLFESDLPVSELQSVDNHLMRPEVQEALKHGIGSESRFNDTMKLDMLYFARKLDDAIALPNGNVHFVRVAVPLTEVYAMAGEIRWKIGFAVIVVIAFVSGLSLFVSQRVSQRIKQIAAVAREIHSGRIHKRIELKGKDEIGQLATVLNEVFDKLNADIAQLRKLERVRSEFLGNVSHELRTPIFALQGYLETLLNGALDDPKVNRDFLEKAYKNATRLNALLSDLIEISSIEFGEMKMSFRYININEYLRSVVSEMQPAAQQKGIDLTVNLQTTDSVQVYADKDRMKQVLFNLIDNGIKYTEPGGTVSIGAVETDGGVKISVADTGCGISAEHLPRIFERFYRVDRDRSREMGGTGLGLAIVKHIVEAHGSKVEVESEVGKGSIFAFTLKK